MPLQPFHVGFCRRSSGIGGHKRCQDERYEDLQVDGLQVLAVTTMGPYNKRGVGARKRKRREADSIGQEDEVVLRDVANKKDKRKEANPQVIHHLEAVDSWLCIGENHECEARDRECAGEVVADELLYQTVRERNEKGREVDESPFESGSLAPHEMCEYTSIR
ncbi:hypothetical protein C8J57DRAFT_1235154 [Mycena rebaudengoi]|nr:hypothetical protein C8J57DRAFT_1235154 [Mycena rebaudengoi]